MVIRFNATSRFVFYLQKMNFSAGLVHVYSWLPSLSFSVILIRLFIPVKTKEITSFGLQAEETLFLAVFLFSFNDTSSVRSQNTSPMKVQDKTLEWEPYDHFMTQHS